MANNEINTEPDEIYDDNNHESNLCSIEYKGLTFFSYHFYKTECHCKSPKPVREFYHTKSVCQPYIKKEMIRGRLYQRLYMRCYCSYEKRSYCIIL